MASGMDFWQLGFRFLILFWMTSIFDAVPTEEQLLGILRKLYSEVEYHLDGSMVYFRCVK